MPRPLRLTASALLLGVFAAGLPGLALAESKATKAAAYANPPRPGDQVYQFDNYLISDPRKFNLPPLKRGEQYYLVGEDVMLVDQESYKILKRIGPGATILK